MTPTEQLLEALDSARKSIECLTCFGNSSIDHQVRHACHKIDRIKHFVKTQLNETPKPLERLTDDEIQAAFEVADRNCMNDRRFNFHFADAIQDAMIKKSTRAISSMSPEWNNMCAEWYDIDGASDEAP